jgi:hypothetical protein
MLLYMREGTTTRDGEEPLTRLVAQSVKVKMSSAPSICHLVPLPLAGNKQLRWCFLTRGCSLFSGGCG